MRTLFRIAKALLKWGTAAVVLLLAGVAVYARVLHKRDDARWRAPGKLVEVEAGRVMHIYCVGSGQPTVVLEAGLGDFGLSSWHSVLPQLGTLSRTCTYDRAGTGWSDEPRVPPTPSAIVTDLHTLLAASGESGPYLMVGHSLGGPLVRHYAVRYPTEVAGLVLVDGSHEDQLERLKLPAYADLVMKLMPAVHALGIDRVASGGQTADTMQAIAAARTTTDAAMRNTMELYGRLAGFLAEVKRDARPFGTLPLVALTAGKMSVPGMSPAAADSMHRAWVAMHQEIVARSTRGVWILARDSEHYIQRDQPDLVIGAVRDLLDSLRAAVPSATTSPRAP